ncbi:hypothetical protein Ddc_10375 [Ditylenchus destructor]|nr:hypothetical protein Ddc_10375 [Ditylenchus destructor]
MIRAIVVLLVVCILESSSLEVKKITITGTVLHAKDNNPAADVTLKFQFWKLTIYQWHDVQEVSALTADGQKTFFNPKNGWFTFQADVGRDLPADARGVRVVPNPENADVVFKSVVVNFNR